MHDERALRIARAGTLQWLSVSVYEAVVRMPDRLADEHDRGRPARRGPFAPGSPARYHLPVAPVVVGSSVAALVRGLRGGRDTAELTVAASSVLAATALTAYLVRTVNLRLLDDGAPLAPEERRRLVRRWHGVNRVRVVLLAVAAAGFGRAAARDR